MKKKLWKNILGYEDLYMVSNFGEIKSLHFKKPLILKSFINRDSYCQVFLQKKPSKPKLYRVHRLVSEAFLPNIEDKPFVNHKNSNRTDNRVENLEWCTASENNLHGFKFGYKDKKGMKHHFCQLNNEQVLEIFNSIKKFDELCDIYNIGINAIRSIKNGRTWSHITKKEYNPHPLVLKPVDVLNVFKSSLPNKELAKIYGVDQSTISGIKIGKAYSNLTGKKRVKINKNYAAPV